MLVTVEGIDGSGKGTLTKMLTELINESKQYTACDISFPRYAATRYGKIVGQYLHGDFGESAQHPIMHGTLFALDRFESRDKIKELQSGFDFVLCDRYVPSNLCYSAMKASAEEREAVVKHFVYLEYDLFEMPKPDVIFFLDIPVSLAIENIAKKNRREYTDRAADIFEADEKYLHEVRSFYSTGLKSFHPDVCFETIECEQNGGLRSIDEIAQQAFSKLLELKKG